MAREWTFVCRIVHGTRSGWHRLLSLLLWLLTVNAMVTQL